MESRPWYKKLFGFKKINERKGGPVTTVREFPLPDTDSASSLDRASYRNRARPRRRGRRYRNPIIPQRVTDPRFNHTLRLSHIARAKAKRIATDTKS